MIDEKPYRKREVRKRKSYGEVTSLAKRERERIVRLSCDSAGEGKTIEERGMYKEVFNELKENNF